MAFNGSGLFVIDSTGQPVVSGTDITDTVHNALTADLATGLSTCITKDGQTTVTANIPMATYKITGLGAGTARTDAASLATIQDGTGVYVATVGGTADVITLTPSPAITAYAAGQTFRFIASGANTTNVTVNISALGAKAITKNGTTALAAGDIPSGMMVEITYDGTRFILGTIGAATDIPKTIVDAKGDILTATAADTPARLAVGTDNYVLVAASGQSTGLNWVDATTVVSAASESAAGKIELATQAEVNAMTDTSRALTPNHNKLVLASSQSLSGQASVTFSSIPSGVRNICIMIDSLSPSGTDDILIQLGDSGGIETSGYLGAGGNSGGGYANGTTGARILSNSAANVIQGVVNVSLLESTTWIIYGTLGASSSAAIFSLGYSKTLSGTLDRIQIGLTGANTFDSGTINIFYER